MNDNEILNNENIRLDAENIRLQEENRIFALEGNKIALKIHIDKNYIPKSKIKEKIEDLLRCVAISNLVDNINVDEIESQVEILEELIKGED